jgi:putative copper export protein
MSDATLDVRSETAPRGGPIHAPLSPAAISIEVRDRAPLLPKVAFVLIGAASLVGTALSNRGLGVPAAWLVPRWTALWAASATIGFLAWRLWYLHDTAAREPGPYVTDLRRRARLVGRALAPLTAVTIPAAFALAYLDARPALRGALVVLGVSLALALARGVDERATAWVALVAATATMVAWALADAGGGLPAVWRVLHLSAFGLWVGGAVWNLSVAIPVGTRHPTLDAVVSGAHQLQRFRRVARVALPTVVVTGALMALPHLTGPGDLVTTAAGRLITTKVGLIVALVVIFITCPLFRQCSPVAGVCDLDELDGDRP